MNQKELVLQQIKHQETDILPYHLEFEPGFDIEERLDEYYCNRAWRSLLDNAIRFLPGASEDLGVRTDSPSDFWMDRYGTSWRTDLRPWQIHEPALKEPSLANYQLPEVDDLFDDDWLEKNLLESERYHDHFRVVGIGFGLFERTWTIRGFENALSDIALHPDFFDELVERLCLQQMQIIERLLVLPVDGVFVSDDWGYQDGVIIGAKRWRRFFKPRLAKMYDLVHRAGKFTFTHCCGSIEEILPDLIEIGLDVYESVQPEAKNNNPYQLKAKYGRDLTFMGGLGSQSTIPFGTPGEIKAEIRNLCTQMGKGGGFILHPAKQIQPETPLENIVAVLEAFLKQAGVSTSRLLQPI